MLYIIFLNGLPRNLIRPLILLANDTKANAIKLVFVTSYDELEDDLPTYQIV